jgi:Na+/proline symporter
VASTIVDYLATYGSNQVMVQRFLSARSPAQMRSAVLFTGLVTVPVVVLLMIVGLALAAYYARHPQLRASLANPDRVVPHFIGHALPSGVAGLVVASIFAATMSVLSAGFNSLATATVVDFVRRFQRGGTPTGTAEVMQAKWITAGWAVGTTTAALLVARLGTIVEIFGKMSGFFSGTILGVFLVGILFRRAGSEAALVGLGIGTAFTAWVSTTPVSWLWYGPAGCAATLTTAFLVSMMLRTRIGREFFRNGACIVD